MPQTTFSSDNNMSVDSFNKTRLQHAVLAQYHRWFQVYERPINNQTLANQVDLLTDDVQINSISSSVTGHAEYRTEVMKLPKHVKNSHKVQSTSVAKTSDGAKIAAKVIYRGQQPDGAVNAFNLSYDMTLTHRLGDLPQFSNMTISLDSPREGDEFIDAYVENRVKSFLHNWLYLVESVNGDSEPFKELLAEEGLSLAFSAQGEPISNFDQFKVWNSMAPKMLSASSHQVENLQFEGSDKIKMTVEFPWQALSIDGKKITGKTHHTWMLLDTNERFLRLKEAKVKWLEPMAVEK